MSGEASPPRTGSLQAHPDPPRTCPSPAIVSLGDPQRGPLSPRRGRRRGEQSRRVRRTAALIPRPPLLRAVRWGVCRSRAGAQRGREGCSGSALPQRTAPTFSGETETPKRGFLSMQTGSWRAEPRVGKVSSFFSNEQRGLVLVFFSSLSEAFCSHVCLADLHGRDFSSSFWGFQSFCSSLAF